MAGGSADLAGSNAPPIIQGVGMVGEGDDPFAGRNIHFGVREHAMGAIQNGMALEGTFIAYSGTFLIFSDYMRPALRLASLMKLRTLYVFTHDSIFLGEDGPTHQPVEQLDSLRAMPGMTVIRPADGVETAAAYAWALADSEGPALLSLSRQKLKALERPAGFALEDIAKGGYLLQEPGQAPDLVLVASGSEVELACDTAARLAEDGLHARVVSMPSLDLFWTQPKEYRESLVPAGIPAVAVEASTAQSYYRLVGRDGLVCGMESFGRSAPTADLAEHFGFTPDQLCERIRDHLKG
jgi:transketolase